MNRGQLSLVPKESPQIPLFKVTRTGDKKFNVMLTCTHCGNEIPVNWAKLVKSMPGYNTRSCTYCFKVSRIRKES